MIPLIKEYLEVGVKKLNAKRSCITISKPIFYEDDNCKMEVIPSENFQASYFANYSYGNIGKQEYTYSDNQDYIKDLSYARTFCSIGELIFLKENGLIQGGDLNTGVVFLDDNVEWSILKIVNECHGLVILAKREVSEIDDAWAQQQSVEK